MDLRRVAVLCSNSRQFTIWAKSMELQRGIKKHFALDVKNFIEYTAFFVNEPKHRQEEKFSGVQYDRLDDMTYPEETELDKYWEAKGILERRVKR